MYITEETRQGGGLAGTALVAAARLGARTAYTGVLGNDGAVPLQPSPSWRLRCRLQSRKAGSKRSTLPLHYPGQPAPGRAYYSRLEIGRQPPDAEDLSPALIGAARMLFIDSTVILPGLRASEVANNLGITCDR